MVQHMFSKAKYNFLLCEDNVWFIVILLLITDNIYSMPVMSVSLEFIMVYIPLVGILGMRRPS